MTNKKAAVDLAYTWVEYVAFMLMLIGFVLAIYSGSAVITYLVSFLSGMFFGRIWFLIRKKEKFPYIIMISFFLIGFVLGSFYGEKMLIIIFYILGSILSYYISFKKWIR